MPTENKTTNLQLNSWLGTDKPMRTDFVSDNNILDTVIGNHLADTTKHFSTQDRNLLTNPFEIFTYVGDGTSIRSISINFNARIAFVFRKNVPLFEYDPVNGYIVTNCAIVCPGYGTAVGLSLSNNTINVSQGITTTNTPNTKVYVNLNSNKNNYVCILIK